MGLEELIGEQAVNEIKGRPFSIDPSINYDNPSKDVKKIFVESAGDLFDVEEYYKKLSENSSDIGTLNDLTQLALKYMGGDEKTNLAIMGDPGKALQQADLLLNTGYRGMAKFIENNRGKILDKLSAEQLYSLVNRVPLYLTGDKNHDRVIALRKKLMQLNQVTQEKGDIGSVIKGEIGELIKKMPKEQQLFLQENSEMYIQSLTRAIIGKIEQAYHDLFRANDGKSLNKPALKKYLEDNYKVIEDVMGEDDRPDKERAKIWDKNLKMQYTEIARELYKSEKDALKKDENKEEEARKKKDKGVGISR
jgi:hypothetical protein